MTVDVLEKDLQRTVIELAQVCGWQRIYHTHDSRRSQHGFPDLVLVRERIVFLELKRDKGKLAPAQKLWLRALRDAGGEVYLIRPRDVDNLAAVLQAREPWGKVVSLAELGLCAALEKELGA